ncbi:MAG: sel1 repeat family protein, partial [Clostridiales bacterium]|nr:sel1 repeat family protein [Clostridiales bacterium]
KDNTKAAQWYEKAAQQGNAPAQYNLGACYYNGEGVARNRTKAKEWFQKAAAQGYEDAKKVLREHF